MSRVALVAIAIAVVMFGGGGLLVAQSWSAPEQTVVQVTVPAGTGSLYVYRGSGPEAMTDWNRCFVLSGEAGPKPARVLASPGQRQWNFLAYPGAGCGAGAAGPLAAAHHVTAPSDLSTWTVTLR